MILAEIARIRPELAAFFGCLYYGALRPEEAVALRRADLILPARGRGTIILAAACPRTGSTWTGIGTPFEPRGLKHRPRRHHPHRPRPARPGRHAPPTSRRVRQHAGREAVPRRPRRHAQRVGLRHAALSLWLNATGDPAEIAARAGTSARVLHDVYIHCVSGQGDTVSRRIEDALGAGAGVPRSSRCGKASGYTNRRHHSGPCPLTCIVAVTQVVPRWPVLWSEGVLHCAPLP
jgi:integrase